MTGQVGRSVRVRHMPHHEHEIEVFDAATGQHLGAAVLADRASREQIAELRGARAERQRRVRADLRAAERARRVRYAAATTAAPPQPLDAVTAEQAATELAELGQQRLDAHLRDVSRPAGAGHRGGAIAIGGAADPGALGSATHAGPTGGRAGAR